MEAAPEPTSTHLGAPQSLTPLLPTAQPVAQDSQKSDMTCTQDVTADVASFRTAFKLMGQHVRDAEQLRVAQIGSSGVTVSTRFEPREPEQLTAKLLAHAKAIRETAATLELAQATLVEGTVESTGLLALRDAIEDVGEELSLGTAMVARLHEQNVEVPYLEQRKNLQLSFTAVATAVVEVFNEIGDLLFLTELWAAGWPVQSSGSYETLAQTLFFGSLGSLLLNTLGRLSVIFKTRGSGWRNVQGDKKARFLVGAGLFVLVAPSVGMTQMKDTLVDKSTGGTAVGRGVITNAGVAKRDPVASAALSAYVAGQAEVRTSVILITTQDLFELCIQIVFALLVARTELTGIFWLSTLGTMLHMVQHGVEAWLVWKTLPQLHLKGQGRDKVFAPVDVDASEKDVAIFREDVIRFAETFGRHVRKVTLRDCKTLDDNTLAFLVEQCPSVQQLDLHGCIKVTSAGVDGIAANCGSLQELHLSMCQEVSSAAVARLAKACPELRRVFLTGCWQMTDTPIQAIAQSCPQLQSLYLVGCVQVTDASLLKIANGCPDLREIYAFHCNRVTDVGISAVVSQCLQLRELGVAHTQATDATCIAAAKSARHLSVVVLAWCTRVTDVGVKALAQLQDLDFVALQNTRVTDHGINALSTGPSAKNIRTVYLRGCASVTLGCVQQIRSNNPQCVVLM